MTYPPSRRRHEPEPPPDDPDDDRDDEDGLEDLDDVDDLDDLADDSTSQPERRTLSPWRARRERQRIERERREREGRDVANRRRDVRDLWLRSQSMAQIAAALGVDVRTVKADIAHIRAQLEIEHATTFAERYNRSLAVFRMVQSEGWQTYYKSDDRSINKTNALRLVKEAEEALNRLEGIDAPERVHAAAAAEVYSVLFETVREVGGDELLRVLTLRLAAHGSGSTMALLSGGSTPDAVYGGSGSGDGDGDGTDVVDAAPAPVSDDEGDASDGPDGRDPEMDAEGEDDDDGLEDLDASLVE